MQIKLIFIINLLLLNTCSTVSKVNEIEYYNNLIIDGIKEANAYKLPTDASEYRPENETPIYYGTYDFIIIGAGSAGAVVANRLSENPFWRILLIEAGQPGNDFSDIPAMQSYINLNQFNWGFTTIPQKHCCLASNGTCPYLKGKGLGGSSIINTMVYARGNKLDYDRWDNAGNNGWSYDNVLPYFKKSENSIIFGHNKYHSTGGYLNVERHKPVTSKLFAFLQANVELGTPIGDYNGKNQIVAELNQLTKVNGRRLSTEKAFLDPAKKRKNLEIITGSYVIKIKITESSKTATGVIFSQNKKKYVATIRKEIVLSAGVIGSPHILMLSGIGPSTHLQAHGIRTTMDLDVGKRMHDHFAILSLFNTTISDPSVNLTTAIYQYLNGQGPLTALEDATAFYSADSNESGVPDYAIQFIPLRGVGISETDARVFGIYCQALHPISRGAVYLKSSDPYEYPLIDINCFSEYNDVQILLESFNKLFQVLETDAFKLYNPQLIQEEACKQYGNRSVNYWKCAIKYNANTAFQTGGTCRMGSKPDEGGVVDNNLKVHGITKLRVVDASVIPVTISSQINAPTIMLAEKASDLIKGQYRFN